LTVRASNWSAYGSRQKDSQRNERKRKKRETRGRGGERERERERLSKYSRMMKYPTVLTRPAANRTELLQGSDVFPDFQVVIIRKWENAKNVIPRDPFRVAIAITFLKERKNLDLRNRRMERVSSMVSISKRHL